MPFLRARRDDAGGPVLSEVTERVIHTFSGVTLTIGAKSLGVGTLSVTNRRLYWLHAGTPRRDAMVDMRQVMMHAVHPGDAAFPDPNLYCQLDIGDDELEDEDDDEEAAPFAVSPALDSEVEQLLATACEVRFSGVPDVEELFAAFTEAAHCNPEEDSDDDDAAHPYPSVDGSLNGHGRGRGPGDGGGGERDDEEPPPKYHRTDLPNGADPH